MSNPVCTHKYKIASSHWAMHVLCTYCMFLLKAAVCSISLDLCIILWVPVRPGHPQTTSDAGREKFKDRVAADSPKCGSWSCSSTAQSASQEDAFIQEGHFDILLWNLAAVMSPLCSSRCNDASQPCAEPQASSMAECLNHRQCVSNHICNLLCL